MQSGIPSAESRVTKTHEIEAVLLRFGYSQYVFVWTTSILSYIKRTAVILHDQYDDDIPKSIKLLCSLPGVGKSHGLLVDSAKIAWFVIDCWRSMIAQVPRWHI